MDDFESLFNLAEAALWGVIAVGMAAGAMRHVGKKRRLLAVAAIAFALFGRSDWIEADTGAWWDPPWLLVLKVACLATLLWTLRAWIAMKSATQIENPGVEPRNI